MFTFPTNIGIFNARKVLSCAKSPSVYYTRYLVKIHPMIYPLSTDPEGRPFQRRSQEFVSPKGLKIFASTFNTPLLVGDSSIM